jgi:hypothetical protein
MSKFAKRLNKLEKNVINDIPNPDETRITILNEAENAFYKKTIELMERMKPEFDLQMARAACDSASPEDREAAIKRLYTLNNSEEMKLVTKGAELIHIRIVQLYLKYMRAFSDASIVTKLIIPLRICWFDQQIMAYCFQVQLVENVETQAKDNHLSPKETKGAVLEAIKQVEAIFPDVPFSEESWNNYFRKHTEPKNT